MTDTPLVSVFMVTYNHERYIRQAIESALMQKTDFPFEIVIGEDCSTDNTRTIVLDYEQRYPGKIRVVRSDHNVGAVANATRTLAVCRGKYVAFLEGDDYWTDAGKLQKQVGFLETHPDFSICFHGSLEVDSNGNEIKKFDLNADQAEVTTIEDLSKGNYIYTASSIFRNNLVPDIPDWLRGLNAGDYPLHLRLAQLGKIKFFPDKMSAYRIHTGGMFTNKRALDLAKGNINLMLRLMRYFHTNVVVKRNLRAQLVKQIQIVLDILFMEGAFRDYFKYLSMYMRYSDRRAGTGGVLANCKNSALLVINKIRRP